MAGNCNEPGRSVASKITSILLTFTEGSEHSLTEIARLAGLPTSTAHRLICELISRRLLERSGDGLYRAGLPLQMIGGWSKHPATIAERAPCVLEDLSAVTRNRARLGVLAGLDVAYIEKQPGHAPVTAFSSAAVLPAHPTALGRVLLAFAPAGVVELTIMRGMRRYTAHTVTSPVQLRRALADTRAAQVAITRQELELGLSGVAMPVFGPGGVAVASIELTVRNMTNGLPLALSAVYIAARSLSRELGGYSRPEHSERAGSAFAGPVAWEPMAASG